MPLAFLHGPPAAGKFTIGRELAARTGAELYHNHAVVDAVLQRHAFGSPEFIAERDRAWRDYFEALRRSPERRVIFTFNPENSVPQAFIDWLFGTIGGGVALHSVEITAPERELEARIDSAQRQQFRKLVDRDLYRRLRDDGVFRQPRIPRTDLVIDSSQSTSAQSAERIAAHLGWT